MRLAVIADIHGNLDALENILDDIDQSKIDEIISLGDNICYGPESEQVVQLLIKRKIISVVGNHELVIQSPRFAKWFNPIVLQSQQIIFDSLSRQSIEYINDLPPFLFEWDCRFVHGFPPRFPLLYLFQMSEKKIAASFNRYFERLCFIGHTHELKLIKYDGYKLEYPDFERGINPLEKDKRYLVNVGSVGQPRDGDNRAKYVIWDSEEDFLDLRFVRYDIKSVMEKIRKAGLPEANAIRLL